MSHLFTSYRLVDAKNIVRDNINPNHVENDVDSLLRSLNPLYLSSASNRTDGMRLPNGIANGLLSKTHTSDILVFLGFELSGSREYVYRSTANETEMRRRENGIKEFRRFFEQLKEIKKNNLLELEEYLRNDDDDDVDDDPDIPFPSNRQIEKENKKNFEILKLFKENIKSKYEGGASHAFIRRRIARLLYKQVYPKTSHDDDEIIDGYMGELIRMLKQRDRDNDRSKNDEIYLECLIRSQFQHEKAVELLTNNRPYLDAPVEPPTPKNVLMDNFIRPVQQKFQLVNNIPLDNRSNDKWEKAQYLVPIIIKMRRDYKGETVDDVTFSKMYRLMFSELSLRIGVSFSRNIEVFIRMLFSSSPDWVVHLDIGSLRTFLTASDPVTLSEHFVSDCPVCYDAYPVSQFETFFLCNHKLCPSCMKNYYRKAIDDVQDANSINTLTCSEERISITSDTHHLFFVWLEQKIRQWFHDDPPLIDKYTNKVMNAASGKQIKKCGNPKCVSSFFADDNPAPTRVRCPDCNFAQCSQCCRKWNDAHQEITCDAYNDWLFENDPDDEEVQALRLLARTAIVCPTCRAIYDYKAGGCEHYKCSACHTDFCRMCSTLFVLGKENSICTIPTCNQKTSLHAHCPPNCFREIRDADFEAFYRILEENEIDAHEELQTQFPNASEKCPVEDCDKDTIPESDNRLCGRCYKQFLSSFIWNQHIQPWELYEDHQLKQILRKASITVPDETGRPALIDLCQQHLNSTLGRPQRLERPRR